MFEKILGNEPIKAYLQKALVENRLPQTLLFAGPDGVGKTLFAKALAAALLQSDRSPDFHIIAPEGKSGLHAIDALREAMDKEHAAPFQSPGKVFLVEEAHRMQPASANALLKTLEEPADDATWILLSSQPQEMLPTILSRCTLLSFQPLAEREIAQLLQERGHPTHLAKLAHGSAGRAFEMAEHPEWGEQRAILFRLLAQKPFYPELSLELEKLEGLVEEGKEEDPIRVGRRVELLFASILMWHRDQHVRKLGRSELLFFPDEPAIESIPEPTPLQEIEPLIDKARMAYQRNMKLSVCLKTVLW